MWQCGYRLALSKKHVRIAAESTILMSLRRPLHVRKKLVVMLVKRRSAALTVNPSAVATSQFPIPRAALCSGKCAATQLSLARYLLPAVLAAASLQKNTAAAEAAAAALVTVTYIRA